MVNNTKIYSGVSAKKNYKIKQMNIIFSLNNKSIKIGGIMLQRKNSFYLLMLFLFISSFSYSQSVKVLRQYDGTTDSYLVAQIKADTVETGGLLSDRVYELTNGGLYLNTEILNVAANRTIRLRAPNGAKPIIYQYPTGTGANPQRPPGNLFVLLGGNLEMGLKVKKCC